MHFYRPYLFLTRHINGDIQTSLLRYFETKEYSSEGCECDKQTSAEGTSLFIRFTSIERNISCILNL